VGIREMGLSVPRNVTVTRLTEVPFAIILVQFQIQTIINNLFIFQ